MFDKKPAEKLEKKVRYVITCQKCGRLYKRFVPVSSDKNIAVAWCTVCDVVLCRFDTSDKEYDESKME